MTTHHIIDNIIIGVIFIYLTLLILTPCAYGYYNRIHHVSAEDLYNVVEQQGDSFALFVYLKEEGVIGDDVSFGDFDYINVLAQQLCTMTDHVKPELALAMIAVESGFDQNAKHNSTRGLMQLIPIYHSTRMEQFVEKDHQIDLDDFFNPRLNIATGLDYMDYLLDETNGDVPYALMWYNQGAISASKDYLDNLRISSYAKKVMELSKNIKTFL